MSVLPVSPGQVFEGKYLVDRVIGEGGMGVVVLAQHLELDQPVAIKFLLDNVTDTQDSAERFRREARAAAKIQSDHVARVFDVGVLPTGERYMVMEYLRGHNLAHELATRGRLPIAYSARLMLEVLEAMSEAHAAGIVHRDLKPGNVFLAARPDGRIRVKVLDFGISKAIGSDSHLNLSLTRTSSWMGSPLYTAPEQMQSARDVDTRVDIWSFGAIFYEVLTGQPPYIAESLPQLCSLLLSQDAGPPRDLRPEIPMDIEDLVLRCLRRPRELRYQNTAELLIALEQCLTNLASGTHHEPVPESLAPIASRLAPLPPSRPASQADPATAGTLLADASIAGAVNAAAPGATANSTGQSTTGSWTSNARSIPPPPRVAVETPNKQSSSRGRLGVALALVVSIAAGAAWLILRPHALPEALAPYLGPGPGADSPPPAPAGTPAPSALPVPVATPDPGAAPIVPSPAEDATPAPSPVPTSPQPASEHATPASAQPRPAKPKTAPKHPSTQAIAPPPSRPRPSDEFEEFGGRR